MSTDVSTMLLRTFSSLAMVAKCGQNLLQYPMKSWKDLTSSVQREVFHLFNAWILAGLRATPCWLTTWFRYWSPLWKKWYFSGRSFRCADQEYWHTSASRSMWLVIFLENAITSSKYSSRLCHCSSFSTFSISHIKRGGGLRSDQRVRLYKVAWRNW